MHADIDGEVTAESRSDIDKLIASELPNDYQTTLHPSIPSLPETKFSSLVEQELQRKADNAPITGGIDLSRYEAPEPPSTDGKDNTTVSEEWKQTLRRAYTASEHLSTRRENLSLLEEHGKNAWLIGNSNLEEILRQIEKELQETKEATDAVNRERKIRQEGARAELMGLEDAWRGSVSGTIDAQVATENLRAEILERRRQQARS